MTPHPPPPLFRSHPRPHPSHSSRQDTEHAFDPEPFLDRFFAVYSGVFSSFPSFDFAVEALMEMVRGGLLSARHHIYRIITVLSRNATFFWSAEQVEFPESFF